MFLVDKLRILIMVVALLFPSMWTPNGSTASGIKCYKDDDTEETCTDPTHTACGFSPISTSQKKGTGCKQVEGGGPCERVSVNEDVYCNTLFNTCCCKGSTDQPCNDLTKDEVKMQACNIQFFKGNVEKGFCPAAVCKMEDGTEVTCTDDQWFCGVTPSSGKGSGCREHGGCGKPYPTGNAIACSQGKCCCYAGAKACNELTKGSQGCELQELKDSDLCKTTKVTTELTTDGNNGNGGGSSNSPTSKNSSGTGIPHGTRSVTLVAIIIVCYSHKFLFS